MTRIRKILTLGMYKGIYPAYNLYTTPSNLTKCKYELRMCNRTRKVITTDTINREVVLTELVKWGNANSWMFSERYKLIPYHIYVTERGVKKLLIDSSYPDHQKFILSLCQPVNS